MAIRNIFNTFNNFNKFATRPISTTSKFLPVTQSSYDNNNKRHNLFWLNQDIARICKEYDHKDAVSLARAYLAKYITYSNPVDWANWIQYSTGKYTKVQVVPPLSGAYTIYLLNWLPGQSSPIHGHPPGGCVMGVLRGTLEETIYRSPSCNPTIYNKKTRILTPGVIGYIDDSIGFHRIVNLCNIPCNSLHIYFHNKPEPIEK
jgi:predicted metal-dependent enzyme (double-stranded beta helix superfamily)